MMSRISGTVSALVVLPLNGFAAELAAPAESGDKLRTLEAQQGEEARKMGKVAGDVSWLLEELESNDLFKYGGGKNLQALQVVVSSVADDRLPAVALHLRDARLETDAARHHMTSARTEVDAIVKELKRPAWVSRSSLAQVGFLYEHPTESRINNRRRCVRNMLQAMETSPRCCT